MFKIIQLGYQSAKLVNELVCDVDSGRCLCCSQGYDDAGQWKFSQRINEMRKPYVSYQRIACDYKLLAEVCMDFLDMSHADDLASYFLDIFVE